MDYPPPAPCDLAPIAGPAFVHLPGVVPVELCDAMRAGYTPEHTIGGERHWITPETHPAFVDIIGAVTRVLGPRYQVPHLEIETAFLVRFTAGLHDRLRRHADNEYEGCVGLAGNTVPVPRCVYSVVWYLSDPGDYVGGELVVDGYGTFRPSLGDAIAMRGDLEHEVTPVRAGQRFIAKHIITVPPTLQRQYVPAWASLA